ncbi:MAG TPA: NPCBM/NEW2 domain-containing protein [Planctomycetaceae bacterium]|nr:NPCBM/NEW2 domain-containing protein [Planctomycetaceae bacterium]
MSICLVSRDPQGSAFSHSPQYALPCGLRLIGALCVLVALWLCAAPFAAVAQTPAMQPATVLDIHGKRHTEVLTELTAREARLAGLPAIPTADIVRIDWEQRRPASVDREPLLLFGNGDQIACQVASIDEEHLNARWTHFSAHPELKVPLETIRGVVLHPPGNRSDRLRLISRIVDQDDKHDVLYLVNGDRLTGQFMGLSEGSFQFDAGAGAVQIAADGVAALAMNPELTSFPRAEGPRGIVTLTDGSRLTVNGPFAKSSGWIGGAPAFGGPPLEILVPHLSSLQFLGGRAVYLSDLEPTQYRFTPYLGVSWPWHRDRNVLGGPLALRGATFAKGLGLHSQSELTYNLDGHYERFLANIGIDDAAQGRGSVVFRVLADGSQVFASEIQRGNGPAFALPPLDVKGVKTLTLTVDFADWGDADDRADWCDALVVKKRE